MIVPENGDFQGSAALDVPMDGDGEGQIIDTQPGREAPREWLPINEVHWPIPLPWHQDVVGTGIAMNERKTMVVAGALDHR